MKPPRDDRVPLPDAGRESTVALPQSLSPFEWPKQDRTITPTVATSVEPTQIVSVAGLAQATRELTREVRRHRVGMRRMVGVMCWLLGLGIVAVLVLTGLLFWLVYTSPGATP